MYNGYGITFDSGGSWSFENSTARNVIIFGVDSSSSSHVDNCKNNFLINIRLRSNIWNKWKIWFSRKKI